MKVTNMASKEERIERLNQVLETIDTPHYRTIIKRMKKVVLTQDPKNEYQCKNDFCPHCMKTWASFEPQPAYPFVAYNKSLDLMYNFILCPTCSTTKGVDDKNGMPSEMGRRIFHNILSLWEKGGDGCIVHPYVDDPLIAPHSADEAIWEWLSSKEVVE